MLGEWFASRVLWKLLFIVMRTEMELPSSKYKSHSWVVRCYVEPLCGYDLLRKKTSSRDVCKLLFPLWFIKEKFLWGSNKFFLCITWTELKESKGRIEHTRAQTHTWGTLNRLKLVPLLELHALLNALYFFLKLMILLALRPQVKHLSFLIFLFYFSWGLVDA